MTDSKIPSGKARNRPIMDKQKQVIEQCRAVAHLADALAKIHRDYAEIMAQSPDLVEQVGNRTASFMETLGNMLNGMDAVDSAEDGWLDPIFEEAHRLWPQPAEH